jgi:hypothetical protein
VNGASGAQGPVGATGATGLQGVAGSVGPIGPIGMTGPQGVAGLNVPAGTIIWIESGAAAPSGYTLVGMSTQRVSRPGQKHPRDIDFDLYRKN